MYEVLYQRRWSHYTTFLGGSQEEGPARPGFHGKCASGHNDATCVEDLPLHTGISEIAAVLGIEAPVGDAVARYNVAPGTRIFLVIAPSENNAVTFSSDTWGFRPASAGERAPRPINARAVGTSRYFQSPSRSGVR